MPPKEEELIHLEEEEDEVAGDEREAEGDNKDEDEAEEGEMDEEEEDEEALEEEEEGAIKKADVFDKNGDIKDMDLFFKYSKQVGEKAKSSFK